jgi:hypothetical protein
LAKYELPKGSVPWNVLNVWPYEPWISGKGYQDLLW